MSWVGENGQRRQRLDEELGRIVEALKVKGAHKIVLFGSMARGGIGSTSDLDLLVVLETELSFAERLAYLYDGLGNTVALDLLPYTPTELAELQVTRPFINRVLREGRVLFEA